MTVCIHYAKPSSGQGEGEVYGLDVAVNNLLSAWFRYGKTDRFICRPVDLESYEHFEMLARAQGVDAANRCVGLDPRTPKHNLGGISCVFRPDPLIVTPIWQRRQVRGRGYAACGLVHTMSGERIARAVGELFLAPADAGDALICPSASVRDAVRNIWSIYSEYLNHHLGGSYRTPIETPVIPLGINTETFKNLTTPDKRAAQRAALQAAEDEIVILFLGRLSFATKAHPLVLWQAAERAAKESKCPVRVVMMGYFKPKDMEPHFRNLAAAIKNLRIDFVASDDERFPDGLWAGADIFASLSDNVQESFGLTPVEAMAAGLPVVASDWDGYRGGVRDGVDGFLIPTYTPPPETGFAIAEHYFNEQNYGVALVGAAQSTVVDIRRCTEAFRMLIDEPMRRRTMGEAGRARAQNVFDWRHIIGAYEELWRELAKKRAVAPPRVPVPPNWQAAHPAFPNPWAMFASFPSDFLTPGDRIRVTMERPQIEALITHEMNCFVPDLLVPKELMLNILDIYRQVDVTTIGNMIGSFPPQEQGQAWRWVGWLLKLGICERAR